MADQDYIPVETAAFDAMLTNLAKIPIDPGYGIGYSCGIGQTREFPVLYSFEMRVDFESGKTHAYRLIFEWNGREWNPVSPVIVASPEDCRRILESRDRAV